MSINVPESVFQKYFDVIDSTFNIFGVTCQLVSIENFISNKFLYWVIRLILIFPIYQFVLIAVATVFGEFSYFKKFFVKFINYFKIN